MTLKFMDIACDWLQSKLMIAKLPACQREWLQMNTQAFPIGHRALTATTALALLALAATPCLAQGTNSGGSDPRRAQSGAAIVTTPDTTPTGDAAKKDGDRMDPSYQPQGIGLGQFLLLPKVEVDEVFNNNIYSTNRSETRDFITVVRPELSLRSRFDNHMLNLAISGEDYRYARNSEEDHTDFKVFSDGRLDVSAETEINGYVQYLRRVEDRGSPDAVNGRTPTTTHLGEAQMGARHQMGPYVISGETNFRRMVFEDVALQNGSVTDNSDRDRNEYSGRLRGQYEIFPSYAAVLETGANRHEYDRKRDRNGYERSSTGQNVLTGLAVDVTDLIRGDFLVGYMRQDYDDPNLRTVSGSMVRATFNWTPTPQTLIVPALESSVSDTTSQNVSGLRRLSANVLGRYELRRNILLSAFAGASRDKYEGTSASTMTGEGWFRGTYSFNSNVYVSSQLGYRSKGAEETTGDYDQTTFMLRLGLQM